MMTTLLLFGLFVLVPVFIGTAIRRMGQDEES